LPERVGADVHVQLVEICDEVSSKQRISQKQLGI
jgi:hypothetical protein